MSIFVTHDTTIAQKKASCRLKSWAMRPLIKAYGVPQAFFLFDHTLFLLPPLRSPTFLIRFLFVHLHLSVLARVIELKHLFFFLLSHVFFSSVFLNSLKLNLKTFAFFNLSLLNYPQFFTTVAKKMSKFI